MTSTYLVDISIHLQPPSFTFYIQLFRRIVLSVDVEYGRVGPFVCRRYQVSVCPLADHRPRPPMHCPFASEESERARERDSRGQVLEAPLR